ncbi:hypothetical protein [Clostridium tyrobutyricum]|uniref:hypothetical protein n=1 Tax=Clostridium tyrobutyricum TaxID=1519 RepID=UPI00189FB092|nr:hypothetical protein [Clostridium tyrobutyricum]
MGKYLGNGIYNDGNKLWRLALRINKNDNQFYYGNAIWINKNLLNENIYDLNDTSNSKYNSFNTIRTNKIMIQMNNHDVVATLNDTLKGKTLYELFTGVSNSVNDDTIENMKTDISPWGFQRNTGVIPSTNIVFNKNGSNSDSFGVRLGIVLGNGYYEGLGGFFYYYKMNYYAVSSGIQNRFTSTFYPCNVYVEYHKYLIKQNDKYYSIKDNILTELGIPTDATQKEQWFNDYGVDDLKDALLTPDENGKKLIGSLDDKFEVRMI